MNIKVLLDESIPRQLATLFPEEYSVNTVQSMGWAGTKNGMLLQLAAEHGFSAFITVDRGFEHQQNAETQPIPVVILIAKTNRFHDLKPILPNVVVVLQSQPKIGVYRVNA